jgi:diguanylate cyclase (GGDEF)-like protein
VELVVKKAEMLRQVFRDARSRMDGNFSISGSIGIAFYPNDGRSYDELFKKADAAMYAAKRSGKDSYRIYVPGIEKIAEMGDPDQP